MKHSLHFILYCTENNETNKADLDLEDIWIFRADCDKRHTFSAYLYI